MDLAALPDPLGYAIQVLGQEGATDPGGWVAQLIGSLGSGGVVGAVLWKLHNDHVNRASQREADLRAENKELRSRLFLLADRGMAVGQTATEVAASEPGTDPELLAQMQELRALLEQRSGR